MSDPYETLGVDPDADAATVKRAYKRKVREVHPDAGGSSERFEAVRRAYDAIRRGEVGDDGGGAGGDGGTRDGAPGDGAGADREGTATGRTRGTRTVGTSSGASVTDLFPAFERPLATEDLRAVLPDDLFVVGDALWLGLVAMREVDVADVVFRHQTEDVDTRRTVAVFHVYNPGTERREWNGWTRTSFVGTDGVEYERSDLQMNPYDPNDRFPAHLTPQFGEVGPGEATNGLLVVEDRPDGVDVDRVVYDHPRPGDGRGPETFRFDLGPEERAALSRAAWLDR